MDFFKSKRFFLILGLIVLMVAVGWLVWRYSGWFGPVLGPGKAYNVILNDARFKVLAVNTLRATTSLEFILPIERKGERVVSRVWCGGDELAIVQTGTITTEEQQLLDKELEKLGTQVGFERNVAVWGKYGAEVSATDSGSFVKFINSELQAGRTPELQAKCQDNTCSVLKKDCLLFVE